MVKWSLMLVFITSLKHPFNCHAYRRVGGLLALTLASVRRQTNGDFAVVVVCNRRPDGDFPPDVHFVEVNFPPPSPHKRPDTGMDAIRLDRGSKYLVGRAFAERFAPRHIMFFDADDFVSARIAKTVNEGPDDTAWIISTGYVMQFGSASCAPLENFHKHCGTSFVHPAAAVSVPPVSPDVSIEEITSGFDNYLVETLLGTHRGAPFHYREVLRRPVEALPYPGAIWVLGNGENHSGRAGRAGTQAVTPAMRREFGIPDDWRGA